MAEMGNFRTVMRGFHKQDVLAYIDTLRQEKLQAEEELNAVRAKLDEAARLEQEVQTLRQALADQTAENDGLKQSIAQHEQAAAAWTEQMEQAATAKEESDQLQQKLDTAEDNKRALAHRVVELEIELRDVKAEMETLREGAAAAYADSERYAALVGNVGNFLMEIRSMGQGYLDAAAKRGNEHIEQLEAVVAAMEQQVSACREAVTSARRELTEQNVAVEQRIAELAREMESAISETEPEPEEEADSWETERYYL